MDEEKDEKHSVGSRECNPGDDVDGLRHSNRMRRFFFANLDETWLKEINWRMNDDTVSVYFEITIMRLHYGRISATEIAVCIAHKKN